MLNQLSHSDMPHVLTYTEEKNYFRHHFSWLSGKSHLIVGISNYIQSSNENLSWTFLLYFKQVFIRHLDLCYVFKGKMYLKRLMSRSNLLTGRLAYSYSFLKEAGTSGSLHE